MSLRWTFPYPSQRMPVFARNVVATSQPLAAQAGLQMLARGGNAVDAALAAAMTLTVVEPTSNGIGSDAFAILWDGKEAARSERIRALAARLVPLPLLRKDPHAGTRLGHSDGARRRGCLGLTLPPVRQTPLCRSF